MALDAKFQELLKNKKILIPAIAIGAIAGLYVLSKSGGMGGGAGAGMPQTPLDPQQPGAGGGGGGSDTSGLEGRIAEIESNQQGFFSQIQGMIQSLSDGFNQQISGIQGQNASALQSVIDQVNSQLSSGQYGGASPYDFAGFQSQLTSALGNYQETIQQRVNQTGGILQSGGGKTFNLPLNRLGETANLPTTGRNLNRAIQGLRSATGGMIPGRNSVGAVVRPSTFGKGGSTGSINRGVPFNIGQTYNQFFQSVNRLGGSKAGATFRPKVALPTRSFGAPTTRRVGGIVRK